MKNSFLYLVILSCLFTQFSFGQERQEETLGKFIITQAEVNGVDVTEELLEAGAYTAFYMYENEDALYMANVWPKKNSQSYGPTTSLSLEYQKDTYEEYEADYYIFDWNYTNDYDDKSGIAKVSVIEFFKPDGIHYILRMVTDGEDTTVYKGYMEGSVNFYEYD